MAWNGDTLALVSEIMNERPMDDVIESLAFRNALYHRVMKTSRQEDFYGEYAKLLLHLTSPMNAVPRVEATGNGVAVGPTGNVVMPGRDTFLELHLTEAQYMSSIGWTQEEVENAIRQKGSAMIDLVNMKVKNAPINMRFLLNYAFQTDGTGRLARVSDYTAPLVTVDNTAADFGWATTKWIRNGMLMDIFTHTSVTNATFPTSSTWTAKAIAVEVYDVGVGGAGYFKVKVSGESDTSLGTSGNVPADGDFVFLHDSINFSDAVAVGSASTFASWANTPGLMSIVDDGYCIAHCFEATAATYNGSWYGRGFQTVDNTVSRASYSQLLSRVWKAGDWGAGSDGTAMACTLEVINEQIRRIDEESETGGMITALYMNGATRDWMAGLAYAQQNAFVQVGDDNKIIPGIPNITGFRSATGRIIPVIPCPQMPDGHITGLDERDLILFQSVPLDWYMGYGGKSIPSPGTRNLTFESWLRTKCRLAAKRCDNAFRIEDIDLTA